MAMLKYREANQVKWIGVRPGHNGSMAGSDGWQAGVGDLVFFTVVADTRIYVTMYHLSGRSDGTANSSAALLFVIGGVTYRIARMVFENTILSNQIVAAGLYFPVELNADDTIVLSVSNAAIVAGASWQGFIEDV